jgi:hypothetical protein
MKRILLLVLFFISSSLVNITALGVWASPAPAQNAELQNALNGLVSPTSAELYFREGQRQLEREIRHLQQNSGTQAPAVLKIDPAILQHQQNLQQLEQQFLDGAFPPQNPTLPMESPNGLLLSR